MLPALSTPITQPPIPAWGELSEKPRLGFTSKNAAWNPGPNPPNSTIEIGMRASLALEGVRPRYRGEQYDSDLGLYYLRARYMNPVTGRFMSRDPNDPQPIDPDHQLYDAEVVPIDLKALHKYLYAGGDPVNTIDPRGRAGEAEDAGANAESVEEAIDNLKSIEKAQQRVRSRVAGKKRIIDVIQKSFDRVDNLLDDIVSGKIDPNDL